MINRMHSPQMIRVLLAIRHLGERKCLSAVESWLQVRIQHTTAPLRRARVVLYYKMRRCCGPTMHDSSMAVPLCLGPLVHCPANTGHMTTHAHWCCWPDCHVTNKALHILAEILHAQSCEQRGQETCQNR